MSATDHQREMNSRPHVKARRRVDVNQARREYERQQAVDVHAAMRAGREAFYARRGMVPPAGLTDEAREQLAVLAKAALTPYDPDATEDGERAA